MFYIFADGELLHNPLDESRIVLTPKLTLEMGKAGSFTCLIPPLNQAYRKLKKLKTIITVEDDDDEIFRGRLVSDPKNFNNVKSLYCEGDLAYLVDSEQKNEAYTGDVHGLFTKTVNAHNARMDAEKRFIRGNVTVENREVLISGQSEVIQDAETGEFDYKQIAINAISNEWKKTLDYLQTNLINYCGGYLRTRRVGSDTYLDYLESYEHTAAQEIEFGVNLLDLADESSVDDIVTVLIPLGDDNVTIASVNGGSDELVDQTAANEFGRIVRTKVFSGVTNPTTLLENGRRYLEKYAKLSVTITIKAVDLHFLNPDIKTIRIGDMVQVKSAPHGIADMLTCSKIEYDLENPANTVYTFGVPKQTLTERYQKDKAQAQETTERTAAATSGGSGGGAASAASDKTDKEMDRIYKEWVDWDPDNPDGHVSIGGLYRQLEGDREKLRSEVGIDLDAVTGNINIKSFKQEFDDLGKTVVEQGVSINAAQTETEAQLTLQAGRWQELDERESGHYAIFEMTANELKSSIRMKADKIEFDAAVTSIYETIGDAEVSIASFSRDITALNSKITTVRQLIADEIKAVKSDITWMKGFSLDVTRVTATSGRFNSIFANDVYSIGGKPYALCDEVYLRTQVNETTIPVLTSISPASTQKITFLVAN